MCMFVKEFFEMYDHDTILKMLKTQKEYKRQLKLRKIKNGIVIFIVAAVFLLFCYGVFGLIVDVLPKLVK